MQRGPSWQAYSSTDSYKTPRILWKVHYSVHNSSETVPIQGQMNPSHAPRPQSCSLRSILISFPI